MRFAHAQSATLSVLATAVPPAARISATTRSAGALLTPSPFTEVPRSLTTTFAPAAAIASAKSRPMPPPAPVTSTTLPSSIAVLCARDDREPRRRAECRIGRDHRRLRQPAQSRRPSAALSAALRLSRRQDTPAPPQLAIIAVAGAEAVAAVEACAAQGVKVAVVMTSGFAETGEEGARAQARMSAAAQAAGMRLIGPNCQGLANFATGLVANFSTIFHELEGRDGPVAIVSQSGAISQAIYTLLREQGVSARHVHATGNEADVTIADLAGAVARDPGVRLVLLYMEAIKDPALLAAAAIAAHARQVPIVALKAGRTASGQRAASSHTGALATEDRVVDAFFERYGIWRAADPHELVRAAALYLGGQRPRGKRLAFVSNSGASCVMAADHAERRGIPLAPLSANARGRLRKALPAFAALANPIDVTGALLSDSGLLGAVLPIIGEDAQTDLLLLALPIAGAGYDVPRFARDLAQFQQTHGIAS